MTSVMENVSTQTDTTKAWTEAEVGELLTLTIGGRDDMRRATVVERVVDTDTGQINALRLWITHREIGHEREQQGQGIDIVMQFAAPSYVPAFRPMESNDDRAWVKTSLIQFAHTRAVNYEGQEERRRELRQRISDLGAERRTMAEEHRKIVAELEAKIVAARQQSAGEAMEAYKAEVRTEAFRVAHEHGFCQDGLNRTMRTLGLREKSNDAIERFKYRIPVQVASVVYVDVESSDEITDRDDAATWADRLVESYVEDNNGALPDTGDDLSDDEDRAEVAQVESPRTEAMRYDVRTERIPLEEGDEGYDADAVQYPRAGR